MQRFLPWMALLAVFAFVAMPSSAHAGYPAHPGTGAWPNYYGWGASPYSLGQVPVPPYFALHPPVYYSMPVPRTYGYSPYAYPGTVMTPEVIMEGSPVMIENPHVTPSSAQPAVRDEPAHEKIDTDRHSVMIENPFVGPSVAAR